MSANVDLNDRPDYDRVLQTLADYVLSYRVESSEALDTARNCLMAVSYTHLTLPTKRIV